MAAVALQDERVFIEEAPPEPSTAARIVGEVVGSWTLGLGIGAAAFVFANQGAVEDVTWFGDIWPTSFGWAITIALGIYCTASLSGAHFNPAVTLALAATGRHPWRQVPRYIACQIVGWFLGAATVVALFGSNIKRIADAQGISYGDPGSASIGSVLTTYVPNPGVFGTGAAGRDLVPIGIGFGAEILGTAILLLVILSLLETRHANAPASWFFPLIVGATIGLLIMFLAGLTQACFNPARDLGPRLMLVVMGFGEEAIPGPRDGAAMAVTIVGPIIGAVLGAFFHDKAMAPLIPGAVPPPEHRERVGLDTLAREPVLHETSTSLLGHAPAMPAALTGGDGRGTEGIDLVMLDVGGTIYDDDCFAQALLRATRELAGGRFDEHAFWHLYDEARQHQSPLREALAHRFGIDSGQLSDRAESIVEYTPSALYPDVKPTLDLLATRYKLGVASQNDPTTEALRRDGLLEYFSVIATPSTAGANKTDARMWKWALDQAGVHAGRAVNVGNRLDSDIRPAKGVGMRSIWLLRGEAPPSPTIEQLTEPDAVVTSFSGVPNALAGMADVRVPAGVS
jgi:MIP family channel proteins